MAANNTCHWLLLPPAACVHVGVLAVARPCGCVLVFGVQQPVGGAWRVLHGFVLHGWRQGSGTYAQVLCLMHPNQPSN